MNTAKHKSQTWGRRLVILIPYLWLAVFFLVPILIVLKISLSQTAIAQPPYTPVFDLSAGFEGLKDFFGALSFDNYALVFTDSLYVRSYLHSLEIAAHLDRASAAHRLPDRLRHGAGAAAPAAAAVHAGGAAVLDLVPDPHLCLGEHPAARRPAQSGAARACASSTRRRCGSRPTPRSISASSIPTCRSWCCRSTPRSNRWTRACSKPPPTSAARAGRRSGW